MAALRMLLAVLLATALLAVTLAAWQRMPARLLTRPATCMPDACFCEAIRPAPPVQPANTWSCVAFVWLGLLIMDQGRRDARTDGRAQNPLRTRRANTVIYGAALILIGLGSGIYHATLTFVGQFFDVFGMYLLATFILLYALVRTRVVPDRMFAPLYVVANGALAGLLWMLPVVRRVAFGVLVVAIIGAEVRARARTVSIRTAYFGAAVASLAVGFAIWSLDYWRIVCVPASLLQGHAIWHALSALSAALVYLYYRSEERVTAAST